MFLAGLVRNFTKLSVLCGVSFFLKDGWVIAIMQAFCRFPASPKAYSMIPPGA